LHEKREKNLRKIIPWSIIAAFILTFASVYAIPPQGMVRAIIVFKEKQDIASVRSLGGEVVTTVVNTGDVSNTYSLSARVKVSSPYKNYPYWFKGNLHSHTENSDGWNTAEEMMAAYRSSGYSFNSLSDHRVLTDSEQFTDLPYFLGINGEEVGYWPTHMLAVGIENWISSYGDMVDWVNEAVSQGGIAIPAHPALSGLSLDTLRAAVDAGARGIEIHGDAPWGPAAREMWDNLLSENRLVYGFMSDDAHSTGSVGRYGWNVVNAESLNKENILKNLEEGNFYCVQSSPPGPQIDNIIVENENVIVISSSGEYVLFIGNNGTLLENKELVDGKASYIPTPLLSYVRMEVYGGGGVSYTQPLLVSFIEPFDVSISPSENDGLPGETLNYEVTVKNTKDVPDNYLLENADDSGWTLKLENAVLEVPAGENRTTTLTVTIPENAEPGTEDNITVTATSMADNTMSDNDSCIAHVISPKAEFSLVTLYKVRLDLDLYLENGSKLVVKFYTYTGDNQGENVVWENVTPARVTMLENVPHPSGLVPVEFVRLVLTTDNENEVISTIASFTATKSVLASRYLKIKSDYVKPGADRPALAAEYLQIKTQYIKAP